RISRPRERSVRRRACVSVGIVALVLAACIPQLEDMTPFPCANDGTCPSGLSCTQGVGCVRAALDSPCVSGVTNCSTAGEGATCTLGICTVACDEKRPCGSGHVCSAPLAAGTGVCVADCTADSACPQGLSCRPLGHDNASGCLGPGQKAPLDGPCAADGDC